MSIRDRLKSWDSIVTAVAADDDNRIDHNLHFGDLEVHPGADVATMWAAGEDRVSKEMVLAGWGMTERAYRQYLAKMGISHQFAKEFSPSLQARMIDEKIDGVDPLAQVFVRTRIGGQQDLVRGILSGRYGNVRDVQVAQTLYALQGSMNGYRVLRSSVSDHLFSVTLLGEQPVFTNGDEYFPIVTVRNSEVGASAFATTSGICKGACSNGMIFGHRVDSRTSIRHLGKDMHDKVKDALVKAHGSIGKWQDTVGPAIKAAQQDIINLQDEKQAEKVVKQLRDRGLTKKFANEVLARAQNMPEETYGTEFLGPVITRWTVLNAMTDLVRQEEDELKRLEVEQVAGQLLLAKVA